MSKVHDILCASRALPLGRCDCLSRAIEPLGNDEREAYLSFWVRPGMESSHEPVKYAAGISLRYEATVQAAEERAERAEALLRAWGIPIEPAPDLMAALKASLAADDAKRGAS